MDLSLLEAAEKLVLAEIAIHHAANAALERVARKVESTAKDEIGTYQPEVGPFPAWPELADSTKDQRVRLGYSENAPLLRSGELRDSIGHEVADFEAVIGSDSDIMVYQEMGTHRIPPRPVLGPAAERNHDTILRELGGAVVAGLLGRETIEGLGYGSVVEGLPSA